MFSVVAWIVRSWCPVTAETVDCSTPTDQQQQNSCHQRCCVYVDWHVLSAAGWRWRRQCKLLCGQRLRKWRLAMPCMAWKGLTLPSYLADDFSQLADCKARHCLHFASSPSLIVAVAISVWALLVLPAHIWIVYRSTSHPHRHCVFVQLPVDTPLQALLPLTAFLLVVPKKWHFHFGHVNCFYSVSASALLAMQVL